MQLNHQVIAAIKTVLPYSVFGAVWIWGSDRALLLFTQNPATISRISMYKGWAFIAVTSALLLALVLRRIRKEDELHRRLESRHQELEEFVYAASHQLRTPLLTISGFAGEIAELAQTIGPNPEIENSVSMIQKGVRQLEAILHGLARLHRHLRANPNPSNINVTQAVRRKLSQLLTATDQAKLQVEIAELPQCFADTDQFEILLHEILDNAVRHGIKHQSSLWISGYVQGKKAIYDFRDNGPGFSNENLEQIMNPILRKQSKQDTGSLRMGLAIASRCAKWNGGELFVSSVLGSGTSIRVELPANR